jgi:hypothetical protein
MRRQEAECIKLQPFSGEYMVNDNKDYSTDNSELIKFQSFTIRIYKDETDDFIKKLMKLCNKYAIDKSEWQFRFKIE